MNKEAVAVVTVYLLAFAAGVAWPLQKIAYYLLVVLSSACVCVPAVMLVGVGDTVDRTIEKIKAREEGQDAANWAKAPRSISLTYIPLVLLLFCSSFWVLALMWLFNYIVMMLIGAKVLDRFKKEEELK